MTKTKVGIIFGGSCEEHPISVKSAQEVSRSIDTEKYDLFWIGITTDGEWLLCDGPEEGWHTRSGVPAVISADRAAHGLLVMKDGGYDTIRLDVVFPLLHGRFGEDGAIQGLLELAGIPYVGCDVQGSAVCMDKSLAYAVAKSAEIATPNFWVVAENEEVDSEVFRFPVFVKPARSGSSFGVSKVANEAELISAVSVARRFDSKVLVEEPVAGSEIGCAVLGEHFELIVSEVDRVNLSHGFFRIHQEVSPETGSENTTFIVPADISDDSRQAVQAAARKIYRVLGCKGLARVDMFLTEAGQVVLNEVNTMPGMTSYSRYPRMMAAAGLPLADVIDRLIATTSHAEKARTPTAPRSA